jgi:hypothetical protein
LIEIIFILYGLSKQLETTMNNTEEQKTNNDSLNLLISNLCCAIVCPVEELRIEFMNRIPNIMDIESLCQSELRVCQKIVENMSDSEKLEEADKIRLYLKKCDENHKC